MNVSGQLQAAAVLKAEGKEDRQCTHKRKTRRVHVTIAPVQKQEA